MLIRTETEEVIIMNLVFRILLLMLEWYRTPATKPDQLHTTRFRAWPHDLRLRNHLPNQRYCNFMELGRMAIWHRSRLASKGLYSGRLIAAQQLVYLRPIGYFQAFEVQSRLLCWDHKYLYYRQEFHARGQLVAIGLTREVFIGKRGKVTNPEQLLGSQPEARPQVNAWLKAINSLR